MVGHKHKTSSLLPCKLSNTDKPTLQKCSKTAHVHLDSAGWKNYCIFTELHRCYVRIRPVSTEYMKWHVPSSCTKSAMILPHLVSPMACLAREKFISQQKSQYAVLAENTSGTTWLQCRFSYLHDRRRNGYSMSYNDRCGKEQRKSILFNKIAILLIVEQY